MAVNIHITIIELNALHTKRQNLFQELDAVIHLLMEDRKSGSAGMPRPISYAVFCLKKKMREPFAAVLLERRAEIGTLATAGSPAFMLAHLATLKARFTVHDFALAW